MDYAAWAYRKVRSWIPWGGSGSGHEVLNESDDNIENKDYDSEFLYDFPKHVQTKEEKEDSEKTLSELYLPVQRTSDIASSAQIIQPITAHTQEHAVSPFSHFEKKEELSPMNDNDEVDYRIIDSEDTPISMQMEVPQELEKQENYKEFFLDHIRVINKYLILLGGASIVSFALRHFLLGKRLLAMEYPGGSVKTLVIYRNSVLNLKKSIIRKQTPLFPGVVLVPADIIHLASWVSPQYTEPITSASQIRNLPEDSYILWSKESELFPIPRRGVDLMDDKVTRHKMDAAIKFVEKLSLTTNTKDHLIDLLLENDKELMTLFHYFHYNPANFSKQAVLYLRSKRKLSSDGNPHNPTTDVTTS